MLPLLVSQQCLNLSTAVLHAFSETHYILLKLFYCQKTGCFSIIFGIFREVVFTFSKIIIFLLAWENSFVFEKLVPAFRKLLNYYRRIRLLFKQFILCFFVSLILSSISILVFVSTDPKTQVEIDFGDDFVVRDDFSTSNLRSETGINVSWYSFSFSP